MTCLACSHEPVFVFGDGESETQFVIWCEDRVSDDINTMLSILRIQNKGEAYIFQGIAVPYLEPVLTNSTQFCDIGFWEVPLSVELSH